jgi:F0F1-type ATP synthase assembly protein I
VNPEEPNSSNGKERPAARPGNGASLSEAPEATPRASADATRQSIESMRAFGTLGSVGLSFVIAIVLGVAAGLLFDRWVGSGHWGFFIGFFLGLAAGVVNVVRASKSIK